MIQYEMIQDEMIQDEIIHKMMHEINKLIYLLR